MTLTPGTYRPVFGGRTATGGPLQFVPVRSGRVEAIVESTAATPIRLSAHVRQTAPGLTVEGDFHSFTLFEPTDVRLHATAFVHECGEALIEGWVYIDQVG